MMLAGGGAALTILLLLAASEPNSEPPTDSVDEAAPRLSSERAVTPASSAPAAAVAEPTKQEQVSDEALESIGDPLVVPSRLKAPPIAYVRSLPAAKDILAHAKRDGAGHLVVPGTAGPVRLTLDADLQEKLTKTLESYQTPYGAVVVLEPNTGRVLALAEHSQANPSMRGLTTKAIFPAASVFKIVTASALMNEGVSPEDSACFHGGKRNISVKMLADSSRDRDCMSLSMALAKSANGVFAKLTHRYLSAKKLAGFASAFHFNQPIDFPVPTDISLAKFPSDPLGLAATGAGFGDVFMSPLHGALLATVAARGGVWQQPYLYEKDVVETAEPQRVMAEDDARKLSEMMGETVRLGTAHKVFHQRGFVIKNAAGKTGSLADKSPTYRDYSWFVGFAPRENPKVAVAVVIVNDYRWRIRAPWMAREAMRLYFEGLGHKLHASR